MPDASDVTIKAVVEDWLRAFQQAIAAGDAEQLGALFHNDCHWRDVLAFTWQIQTLSGRDAVVDGILQHVAGAATRTPTFAADHSRTPARQVTRAGTDALEAFFTFTNEAGSGNGLLRLHADADGALKAWTLMTALDQIAGHEEPLGETRPTGDSDSRDYRGPNWLDRRHDAVAYQDREPAVLVVGCGQAGVTVAARLGQLGVDTLVVDRNDRIGDNWRLRYHALTLHNKTQVNHLPYMPFPPNWPTYIPKDKLANWLEAYAEAMELNVWTGTDFKGGRYDDAAGCWSVDIERNGQTRTLRPRHVVMATGVSGIPNRPEIAGLAHFAGEVIHASDYDDGEQWSGKRAIVIGTGNSGHDIAQDLHSSGADVTLVQRNPTLVVQIEPSAQLPYTMYWEGPTVDDCDLITISVPLPLLKKTHQQLTDKTKELDRPLLDRLRAVGFELDFGEDGTGWQFKYLTRGGGYYFNVGCSDLIADGKVRLVQFKDIETFDATGAVLAGGGKAPADLIVLATGYKGQDVLVRRLLGDEIGDRVGPVWGYGEDQELRNMFVRTRQPGLWFMAGSLAQCRIYSKYLGLQIKACEEGLIHASP